MKRAKISLKFLDAAQTADSSTHKLESSSIAFARLYLKLKRGYANPFWAPTKMSGITELGFQALYGVPTTFPSV